MKSNFQLITNLLFENAIGFEFSIGPANHGMSFNFEHNGMICSVSVWPNGMAEVQIGNIESGQVDVFDCGDCLEKTLKERVFGLPSE